MISILVVNKLELQKEVERKMNSILILEAVLLNKRRKNQLPKVVT